WTHGCLQFKCTGSPAKFSRLYDFSAQTNHSLAYGIDSHVLHEQDGLSPITKMGVALCTCFNRFTAAHACSRTWSCRSRFEPLASFGACAIPAIGNVQSGLHCPYRRRTFAS